MSKVCSKCGTKLGVFSSITYDKDIYCKSCYKSIKKQDDEREKAWKGRLEYLLTASSGQLEFKNKELFDFAENFYKENKKIFKLKSKTPLDPSKLIYRSDISINDLKSAYKLYASFNMENEIPIFWLKGAHDEGILFTNSAMYYSLSASKKFADRNTMNRGRLGYEEIQTFEYKKAILTENIEITINGSMIGATLIMDHKKVKGAFSLIINNVFGPQRARIIPDTPIGNTKQNIDTSGLDVSIKLKQLKELFDGGIITEDDFNKKKQELLSKI